MEAWESDSRKRECACIFQTLCLLGSIQLIALILQGAFYTIINSGIKSHLDAAVELGETEESSPDRGVPHGVHVHRCRAPPGPALVREAGLLLGVWGGLGRAVVVWVVGIHVHACL